MGWLEIATFVGVVINILTIIVMLFKWGKWVGCIEEQLKTIFKRFDLFEDKYGDVPERVARLEGMHEKERGN